MGTYHVINIFMNLFLFMINAFISLIFPSVCSGCERTLVKQERNLCIDCIMNLPRTLYHRNENNPIEKMFWGRLNLNSASAFVYFSHGGNVRKMIHSLKYKNDPGTALRLGELFAKELITDKSFPSADFIIPVPLHPSKRRKRGYNQSEEFSKGIAKVSGVPVFSDGLIRVRQTQTQTNKSRFLRWENVEAVFKMKDPELLIGKHVILVDDVITTGATLEACGEKILGVPGTRLSILSIACA